MVNLRRLIGIVLPYLENIIQVYKINPFLRYSGTWHVLKTLQQKSDFFMPIWRNWKRKNVKS